MRLLRAGLQAQLGCKGCCHAPRAELQYAAALSGASVRELALHSTDPGIQAAHVCKVPGCHAAAGHCSSLPGLAGEVMDRLTANAVESMCRKFPIQILVAVLSGVQTRRQHLSDEHERYRLQSSPSQALPLHCRRRLPEGSTVERSSRRRWPGCGVQRWALHCRGGTRPPPRAAASALYHARSDILMVSQVEEAQQGWHGGPLHTCDHRTQCFIACCGGTVVIHVETVGCLSDALWRLFSVDAYGKTNTGYHESRQPHAPQRLCRLG